MSLNGMESNLVSMVSNIHSIAEKMNVKDISEVYLHLIHLFKQYKLNTLLYTVIIAYVEHFPLKVNQEISDIYMFLSIVHKLCISRDRLNALQAMYPSEISDIAGTVFATGKQKDYKEIPKLSKYGITSQQCVDKIKILGFINMAIKNNCIPFDSIKAEIGISEEEIAEFVMSLIENKIIEAKIDDQLKCVYVECFSSSINTIDDKIRTFSRWNVEMGKMENELKKKP